MSGTNTDSIIWVAGETTGSSGAGGTAAIPAPFYQASDDVAPSGTPVNGNVHITSASGVYLYNGSIWNGPYLPS